MERVGEWISLLAGLWLALWLATCVGVGFGHS